jgi:ABC-type amino acid transport substrate-binding protein
MKSFGDVNRSADVSSAGLTRSCHQRRIGHRHRIRALILASLVLGGGCQLPHDAEGTAKRVQGGVMRVGVSAHAPWVTDHDGKLGGVEVELIRGMAKHLDARIEWTRGTEAQLMELLHRHKLDVVIAGLDDTTPWSDRVALTEPYVTVRDPLTGKKQKHVWASAPGESRWLLELDRYLQASQALRLLRESRS